MQLQVRKRVCPLLALAAEQSQNLNNQCDKKERQQTGDCAYPNRKQEFHSSINILPRDHRESLHNL